LNELAKEGKVKASVVSEAIKSYGLDPEKTNPMLV
jgi:pyruvate dehydrogenase complex dehydrogenase (E1) component